MASIEVIVGAVGDVESSLVVVSYAEISESFSEDLYWSSEGYKHPFQVIGEGSVVVGASMHPFKNGSSKCRKGSALET